MRQTAATLILGVSLFISACGGGSPTAPAAPPPPPPPPPAPVYPNMIGAWFGQMAIVVSLNGQNSSNVCTNQFTVTGQTAGDFSGTFQSSGGTTSPCGQAGTFTGNVSTTGQVTNYAHNVTVGALPPTCQRLSGDGVFSGILSGGVLSLTTSDTLRCTSGSLTATATRNLTITAQK